MESPQLMHTKGRRRFRREDDTTAARSVIGVLLHGRRPLNRAAAAHALNLMHAKAAIIALEKVLGNKQEHPKVRGQAAESLAHNHRPKSHDIVLANLDDPSKEVRFWCAFALAQMAEQDALAPLKNLSETDHRVVRGFWSVSKEAGWGIREIRKEVALRPRRHKSCLYCAKS
jgi:HEAT repeat protein